LLGSLRWWFEVLVRGLGGSACDPADSGGRCPDKNDKHCVVCELFGCTGWARKFRFDVLDKSGMIKRDEIKKDETFRFRLTPLRPMREEEWALLDLTLRLIADYGAIGGKTVLKPSDEKDREKELHHQDYGLVAIAKAPDSPPMSKEVLQRYLASGWRSVDHRDFGWASLENFWCVSKRFLGRQSAANSAFNQVVGRKQPKQQGQQLRPGANEAERWLAGGQQESKKVFSFKDPPRTFGFVKPGLLTLDEMRKRLKVAWQDLKNEEFLTGPTILERLVAEAKGGAR
jgi:CRISPR-associated protein Cmr1